MSAKLAPPELQTSQPEPPTQGTPCVPEPLFAQQPTLSASRSLPPTQRDFEIYEAVHIAGSSTWAQARKHDISQTRVRQIVRRVVEWVGQVLPPQAKIAKEQETHLARQIAAGRFQHQLEEATIFWNETHKAKYASLRLRITTAQARLGVVSGVLDGLAADAIEGIPVPTWQPEVGCASPDPALTQPADEPSPPIQNPKSQIHNSSSRRPIDPGQAQWLNKFRNIWPPTERVRLAVELEEALQLLPPEHREAIRASEAHRLSPQQLALEAAVRAGHIPGDEAFLIDPATYAPPNEDFSQANELPSAATESLAENLDASPGYDNTTGTQLDPSAPSVPLLTSRELQPVTALNITPAQPGVTISTTPYTSSANSPPSPVPVPSPLHVEPSRPAAV